MAKRINFIGSIPKHYEEYLTDFLFDGFAQYIVSRIDWPRAGTVLELAAGTGCVTRYMLDKMPGTVKMVATDVQKGMLEIASKNLQSPDLEWAVVDMTSIPYHANMFELAVCQFGLMLVQDKRKALKEAYRVLKPGGQLLFTVE